MADDGQAQRYRDLLTQMLANRVKYTPFDTSPRAPVGDPPPIVWNQNNPVPQGPQLVDSPGLISRVLDIASRLRYGTTNVIKDWVDPDPLTSNPLESFWAGLSGVDKTSTNDILNKVSDVTGKSISGSVRGGLGLAGDIGLDPLSYLAGPITKAVGAAAKPLKGIVTGTKAAEAAAEEANLTRTALAPDAPGSGFGVAPYTPSGATPATDIPVTTLPYPSMLVPNVNATTNVASVVESVAPTVTKESVNAALANPTWTAAELRQWRNMGITGKDAILPGVSNAIPPISDLAKIDLKTSPFGNLFNEAGIAKLKKTRGGGQQEPIWAKPNGLKFTGESILTKAAKEDLLTSQRAALGPKPAMGVSGANSDVVSQWIADKKLLDSGQVINAATDRVANAPIISKNIATGETKATVASKLMPESKPVVVATSPRAAATTDVVVRGIKEQRATVAEVTKKLDTKHTAAGLSGGTKQAAKQADFLPVLKALKERYTAQGIYSRYNVGGRAYHLDAYDTYSSLTPAELGRLQFSSHDVAPSAMMAGSAKAIDQLMLKVPKAEAITNIANAIRDTQHTVPGLIPSLRRAEEAARALYKAAPQMQAKMLANEAAFKVRDIALGKQVGEDVAKTIKEKIADPKINTGEHIKDLADMPKTIRSMAMANGLSPGGEALAAENAAKQLTEFTNLDVSNARLIMSNGAQIKRNPLWIDMTFHKPSPKALLVASKAPATKGGLVSGNAPYRAKGAGQSAVPPPPGAPGSTGFTFGSNPAQAYNNVVPGYTRVPLRPPSDPPTLIDLPPVMGYVPPGSLPPLLPPNPQMLNTPVMQTISSNNQQMAHNIIQTAQMNMGAVPLNIAAGAVNEGLFKTLYRGTVRALVKDAGQLNIGANMRNATNRYDQIAQEKSMIGNAIVQDWAKTGIVPEEAWNAFRGKVDPASLTPEMQRAVGDLYSLAQNTLPTSSGIAGYMDNVMFRQGATPQVMEHYFRSTGIKDFKFQPMAKATKANPTPVEITDQWRAYETKDPIGFLVKMDAANQKFSAWESTGRQLSEDWGSVSAFAGGQRIARNPDVVDFTHHIDNNRWFSPEVIKGMQAFTKEMAKPFTLQSKFLKNTMAPILNMWKLSNTVARPGHIARNAAGDFSINTLDRMWSHKWYVKAAMVQKAGGFFLGDAKALDRLVRGIMPVNQGEKVITGIKLKGGISGGDLSASQTWMGIHKSGGWVSYKAQNDLVMESATGALAKTSEAINNSGYIKKMGQINENIGSNARAAQVIKKMQDPKFTSQYETVQKAIDGAVAYAQKYHPDVTGLTNFERRVMRNLIPFYSWFRQTTPTVMKAMVTNPAAATLPSKIGYNLSVATGNDPQNFQDQFAWDSLFPSFIKDSIKGPANIGGTNFSYDFGTPVEGLGQMYNGDVGANLAGMLNPLIKLPIGLITGNQPLGHHISDQSEWIDQNLPFTNQIGNLTGYSPIGSVDTLLSSGKLDQQRAMSIGEKDFLFNQNMANFIGGLSLQNIDRPSYRKQAISARDTARVANSNYKGQTFAQYFADQQPKDLGRG